MITIYLDCAITLTVTAIRSQRLESFQEAHGSLRLFIWHRDTEGLQLKGCTPSPHHHYCRTQSYTQIQALESQAGYICERVCSIPQQITLLFATLMAGSWLAQQYGQLGHILTQPPQGLLVRCGYAAVCGLHAECWLPVCACISVLQQA